MNEDLNALNAEREAIERQMSWMLIDSQEDGVDYSIDEYQELQDVLTSLFERIAEAQEAEELASAKASTIDLAHLTDDLLAELRAINSK